MHRRVSHVHQLLHTRKADPEWPTLLLDTTSEEFAFSQADVALAPEDPRIQDPNIAPWAELSPEEEETQVNHL
jgi:hypothetical protein